MTTDAKPLRNSRFQITDIPDQSGQTILITGANAGLGLESATALARAGARILLACRNQDTGRAALGRLDAVGPGAGHQLIRLDLADLDSVRAAATEAAAATTKLDVLINNAGVMAIPFARTADGFEMQIGTNHFGHFALTDALLPLLLNAPAPRVVTLSSIAHRRGSVYLDDLSFETRPYHRWAAYSQSKLANLLFSSELARRSSGTPLTAVAAHPGVAATNLFDSVIPPIPGAKPVARLGLRVVGNDERDGALSQLYAATMPDVAPDDYLGPTRLNGMRGPVRRSPRSRRARNTERAAGLWASSVYLTGATFDALAR